MSQHWCGLNTGIIQLITELFQLVVIYLKKAQTKQKLEMKGKSKLQVQGEATTAQGTAHCTKDCNKSEIQTCLMSSGHPAELWSPQEVRSSTPSGNTEIVLR